MRVVQSISLDTELDEDVLIYLKSVPNKSQFIKDCIRTHLSKTDNFTKSQLEQIREIVHSIVSIQDTESGDKQKLASALNECLDSFIKEF